MNHARSGLGVAIVLAAASAASVARSAEQPAPPSDVSRQEGSLSSKLGASSGVIHPEGTVDPGMQKAPPATGSMPVVPAPGTPGGRQDVIPK